MAIDKSRFTLLAFPQNIDATGKLSVNLVFLPRNINPLVDVLLGGGGTAPAFVSVKPQFTIKVVNNPNEFPGKNPIAPDEVIRPMNALVYSTQLTNIYKTLKDTKKPDGTPKYFDIDETRNADTPAAALYSANDAMEKDLALRKYLPYSYRQSFNFTAPRIPNAVTDDSYHCAVRDQTPDPAFAASDNKVSWGKVYAHLMRQPFIAKAAGLIYQTSIQLNAGDLEQGGWIYADILAGDYSMEQAASEPVPFDPFIKKYAAKIPPLKPGEARPLFSAVLFPVMKSGQSPVSIYDELFIESARYSNGFAGLVHSFQPRSHNLLREEADGIHPQKELGIRLGWDDEQILIWYLRQLAKDENHPTKERLDGPLGVTGYNVDVRQLGDVNWESLTAVISNGNLMLENITIGNYTGELPYQVYPTMVAGNYWLPMYFANWNDQSIVLPDKRAADIYANHSEKNIPASLSDAYNPPAFNTKLKYGNQYEFRVRMRDMSGGGPDSNADPGINIPGVTHKTHFKRFVAPNELLLRHSEAELRRNTDDVNFTVDILKMQRPILGYPAVLYTGKYTEATALNRLRQNRDDNFVKQQTNPPTQIDGFGIPDLDVVKVQLTVEVETLKMDNLASESGRENYIRLYTTYRIFDSNNPDDLLQVPITWKDQPILELGDTTEPFDNALDNDTIAETSGPIVLPRARNIRLTIRACAEGNGDYWGNINDTDASLDSRLGKTTLLSLRKESAIESVLFTSDAQFIQGIFLQPDPPKPKRYPLFFKTLNGNNSPETIPDIVQRLSKQLDVEAKELTITASNGERILFWCSNLIRHSMAPDNSSITFSGANELTGHWLVCTTLFLNRDWSWDSLDGLSFILERKRKQGREPGDIAAKLWQPLGSLDVQRIASFQAIQKGKDGFVHRKYTKIIVIDIVDGNPPVNQFPDITQVIYSITPRFIEGQNPHADGPFETKVLTLPATVNPTQSPKLVGAGIALSPYVRNKKYSATEARQRYMWLEFDRKPDDENDDLFARVLTYAPDQLISNNDPVMLEVPEESNLPIDPEYIRVIIPDSSHEHAGLNAMQKMEKSLDKHRHYYILPLPPGLHHESAELFGFFTYEFRFGHSDRLWSTAQGRFGRALRVAGLQHPAPNLLAMVNRDDIRIRVTAPFAKALFNGKNVTSVPPRTSIWCLLYAQVKQADGLDYRNILLEEKRLTQKSQERHYNLFKEKIANAGKNKLLVSQLKQQFVQTIALENEAQWLAYGEWDNSEVAELLELYGLPQDSPLSILCVEIYGQITNIHEHINNIHQKKDALISKISSEYDQFMAWKMDIETTAKLDMQVPTKGAIDPLRSQLGFHRILRTSPLTEVPFICCTEC